MIQHAQADLVTLKSAMLTITSSDEWMLCTTFSLMQQVVEKSLKAVLDRVGLDPREGGHRITSLYNNVKNHAPTALSKESVDFLETYAGEISSYAVSGRYLYDVMFTFKRAKELLPCVEKVYTDCGAYLEKSNNKNPLRQMKLFLL